MREINKKKNTYLSKLLKLIPTEIVAAYVFASNVIPKADRKIGMAIVVGILFLLTPVYLRFSAKVKSTTHLVISTLSFGIWAYAMGYPFKQFGVYLPWVAAVLMFFWTTFMPIFFKKEGIWRSK